MSAPRVTIYTSPTCTYCHQAKAYLRARGVAFEERDVSLDPAAAAEMVRLSGQHGVPVITVDGQVVVGFDRRRLERLLSGTSAPGGAPKPSLGLAVADASRITAQRGEIPVFGAFVGRARPGSPGERAGLRSGDIITEIGLRPVRNAADVEKAMESAKPGARLSIVFLRGDQTLRTEVAL